jgi:hypothetical protein
MLTESDRRSPAGGRRPPGSHSVLPWQSLAHDPATVMAACQWPRPGPFTEGRPGCGAAVAVAAGRPGGSDGGPAPRVRACQCGINVTRHFRVSACTAEAEGNWPVAGTVTVLILEGATRTYADVKTSRHIRASVPGPGPFPRLSSSLPLPLPSLLIASIYPSPTHPPTPSFPLLFL